MDDQETTFGARCVAAPVLDESGKVAAVLAFGSNYTNEPGPDSGICPGHTESRSNHFGALAIELSRRSHGESCQRNGNTRFVGALGVDLNGEGK